MEGVHYQVESLIADLIYQLLGLLLDCTLRGTKKCTNLHICLQIEKNRPTFMGVMPSLLKMTEDANPKRTEDFNIGNGAYKCKLTELSSALRYWAQLACKCV